MNDHDLTVKTTTNILQFFPLTLSKIGNAPRFTYIYNPEKRNNELRQRRHDKPLLVTSNFFDLKN